MANNMDKVEKVPKETNPLQMFIDEYRVLCKKYGLMLQSGISTVARDDGTTSLKAELSVVETQQDKSPERAVSKDIKS